MLVLAGKEESWDQDSDPHNNRCGSETLVNIHRNNADATVIHCSDEDLWPIQAMSIPIVLVPQ